MAFDREPVSWLSEEVPVFAPRTAEDRSVDRYDRDFSVPDVYTGIAYGHRLFGDGSAEGLYRTMSALVLGSGAKSVLDAGCGVGRLLYDCAPAMPSAEFAGVDLSYSMCLRASALLKGREPVALPGLARWGWPGVVFPSPLNLENVRIAQASVLDLPFSAMTFETVVATLLLCRLPDPVAGLAQLVRVLRPGGRLFVATPCGFNTAEPWMSFVPEARLREHLAVLGLRVDEWFENLAYRERIDAHGNAHDWRVRVIAATLVV
jgi:SAM-dependent methyltransferase